MISCGSLSYSICLDKKSLRTLSLPFIVQVEGRGA